MAVEDVIKLTKAGLSDDVVIQQIKKKGQPFDLSTDQLLQLKSAHVSDRVIEAMTENHAPEETALDSSSQQAAGKNSAATVLPPDVKVAALGQGPFGFTKGMTRQQVIHMVGAAAVKYDPKDPQDSLSLTTAPKPHLAFEEYTLYLSPTAGLLKVVAFGKTIETDAYGMELQRTFADIVKGVSNKYGPPEKTYDYHYSTDLFREDSQWMMALYDKDRVLVSFWQFSPPVNNVTTMKIETKALNSSTGLVEFVVEFAGWEQYVDDRKAKQDQSY
jgi:hypothetical protein